MQSGSRKSPVTRAEGGPPIPPGMHGPGPAAPAADDEIERFGKTTRWLHWTFVTCFLALAVTGIWLLLRSGLDVPALAAERLRDLHVVAAVALGVLPSVIWLSGQTRETTRDFLELLRWSRDDLRWLLLQPRAALGRATLPPAGKLNAGQKLNGLVSWLVTGGMLASGVVLWLRPGSFLALLLHLACFALWVPFFLVHLCMATLVPSTRHALHGMIRGRVRRAWAEHHHARWVDALEPPPRPTQPSPLRTGAVASAADGRS
jgi:formate dehydrogenase subunit gamma